MARPRLMYVPVHARGAGVESLHAVHAHVAYAALGIDRVHHRQRDERPAVVLPRAQQRQTADVGLVAFQNYLLTRSAPRRLARKPSRHVGQQGRAFGRERSAQHRVDPPRDIVERLRAQSQRHAAVGTHHVGEHGKLGARVFEQQGLAAALALGHAVGDLGYLETRRDARPDAQQFAVPFEGVDIFAK